MEKIRKIYNLSKHSFLETDFTSPEIYDPSQVQENRMIRRAYNFMADMEILGLPLDFLLALEPRHSMLVIMASVGELIGSICTRLSISEQELPQIAESIGNGLDSFAGELTAEHKHYVRFILDEFVLEKQA